MDMARKDHVNLVLDEPALKSCSHAFTLHIVSFITVVEWHMHENNEPRCLVSINPFQLFSEPFPLWCVLYCYERTNYLKKIRKKPGNIFKIRLNV